MRKILAKKENCYTPASESAGYLQKHHAKFAEMGIQDSSKILEFVTPQHISTNTLVTLPVAKYKNEVYVGLEIENLPVPQLHSGNSTIAVAPAYRLPKEIKTYKGLENFIKKQKIYGTRIKHYSKLGEKFFPSVGITPEQVYPYVVSLYEATEGLQWVNLHELYNNLEQLKDGHLLISIVRLVHAIQ